jgi:hypothetical protein
MVSYAKEKRVRYEKVFPNAKMSFKYTEIKEDNSYFKMILKDTA